MQVLLFLADHFDATRIHLAHRDVTLPGFPRAHAAHTGL